MANDFRAMCAELLDADDGYVFGSDLVNRARTLLDQPEPPELTDEELLGVFLDAKVADMKRQGGLTSSDANGIAKQLDAQSVAGLRAAIAADRARRGRPTPQSLPSGYIDPEHKGEDLALLQAFYQACRAEGGTADEIHLRGIRAVLAANPTPQPPADGEVAELVEWVSKDRQWLDLRRDVKDRILRIADLLQHQHPQPVPVSERLPGAEDCLDEGWAWFFNQRIGWRQAVLPVSPGYTHWLPANALPVPAEEVQ